MLRVHQQNCFGQQNSTVAVSTPSEVRDEEPRHVSAGRKERTRGGDLQVVRLEWAKAAALEVVGDREIVGNEGQHSASGHAERFEDLGSNVLRKWSSGDFRDEMADQREAMVRVTDHATGAR